MTNPRADLHTHTKASDGLHSPAENVRMAKENGLAGVAITDHDTVAGIPEAREEGNRLGITVIPGVEISTAAGGQDIHVLGYFMNTEDPVFLERLKSLRDVRENRNRLLIERLRELGVDITMEAVIANMSKELKPDETVGRPHFAEFLTARGYASDMKDAFDRYLGKDGAAYISPMRIPPSEAVRWIHEAGGCAVLAHPGLYGQDDLIPELAQAGLDGLEVFHSDHSAEDEERYAGLANRHHLFVTGGSDFHGSRGGSVFHGPIGSRSIPIKGIETMKKRSHFYENS
ncbi:PHP domain-containing protein [Paenibacillus sp. CC-CFT747]|nr:PHP domain-containing protein [Paenibacillus sp. CC-CFT747]